VNKKNYFVSRKKKTTQTQSERNVEKEEKSKRYTQKSTNSNDPWPSNLKFFFFVGVIGRVLFSFFFLHHFEKIKKEKRTHHHPLFRHNHSG